MTTVKIAKRPKSTPAWLSSCAASGDPQRQACEWVGTFADPQDGSERRKITPTRRELIEWCGDMGWTWEVAK